MNSNNLTKPTIQVLTIDADYYDHDHKGMSDTHQLIMIWTYGVMVPLLLLACYLFAICLRHRGQITKTEADDMMSDLKEISIALPKEIHPLGKTKECIAFN